MFIPTDFFNLICDPGYRSNETIIAEAIKFYLRFSFSFFIIIFFVCFWTLALGKRLNKFLVGFKNILIILFEKKNLPIKRKIVFVLGFEKRCIKYERKHDNNNNNMAYKMKKKI